MRKASLSIPTALIRFLDRFRPAMARLAALSVLVSWGICALLTISQPWQAVETKLFDWLSVATAPGRSSLPITIIGIDEASAAQIGKPWPWPRDVHARLVDRLAKAGAGVIAFDVVFSEPGPAEEDRALADAIRAAGNVVLAADVSFMETATMRQWRRIDPAPAFGEAGALAGVRNAVLDDDAVIRLVPEDEDAFWRQVVRTLRKARPGVIPEPYVAAGSLLRHLGPPRTFPYIPYHLVLNGDASIPDAFFKDQVILIGRDVRATLEISGAQGEAYATPFLKTSRMLTPGVEIQATLIENALMGQTLAPARLWWNLLVLTVALAAAGVALAFWHPLRSGLVVMAIGAGVVLCSTWLFYAHGIWQFTGAPLLGLLLSLGLMGAAAYWAERQRVNELRTAFKKYVSPEIVNEIIASHGQLKLGGERRELTVLFCDLAGFTTLCEQLSVEEVAEFFNLYANEMTRVVMDHGGTVDKFIGDSVMAFWGAPLPDADHATHAVNAALAMQAAMEKLQPRFSAMRAGRLVLRVGLHSGPAIVGNMGSDLRFEYTALGDTVNLASRLEEANKAYGTTILLSGSTASLLDAAIRLRRVDRIRVKGKQASIDVYTPCADAALVRASDAAWSAYIRRDWQTATALWTDMEALNPYDGLPRVFLDRIAGFNATAPARDWDGAIGPDAA